VLRGPSDVGLPVTRRDAFLGAAALTATLALLMASGAAATLTQAQE